MKNEDHLAWWAHLMSDHPRGWWHHCLHEAKKLAKDNPKDHADLPRLLKEIAKKLVSSATPKSVQNEE